MVVRQRDLVAAKGGSRYPLVQGLKTSPCTRSSAGPPIVVRRTATSPVGQGVRPWLCSDTVQADKLRLVAPALRGDSRTLSWKNSPCHLKESGAGGQIDPDDVHAALALSAMTVREPPRGERLITPASLRRESVMALTMHQDGR